MCICLYELNSALYYNEIERLFKKWIEYYSKKIKYKHKQKGYRFT